MEGHWLCAHLLFVIICGCFGHHELNAGDMGPLVRQTNGEPWPKPQLSTTYGASVLRVRPKLFRFKTVAHTCEIVEEALKRYYSIIVNLNVFLRKNRHSRVEVEDSEESKYLDVLNVHLMSPCEDMPHEDMDESYEIKINSPDYQEQGLIAASSNWGLLRGLETFSQLIHPNSDFTNLQVKSILIVDYPRFQFRSLLLDTSRHFLPKESIYANLDLMAMNKYNVFHWHIVDDESFPYQSTVFPVLSEKGAYHPYTHVYTKKDISDIIEYARFRGIRVIPEFDSPGHTLSWVGISNLLTTCYNKTTGIPNGKGPIDPTIPQNYDFLRKLFGEVAIVFPDKYIHLGGDEVDFRCWESNPKIQDFMRANNFSEDYTRLEEYYMQNLVNEITSLPQKKSYLVWQEVFDNNVEMDSNTVIHVWKSNLSMQELENVTAKGYRAVLSSCWYLNLISYGVDWVDYYKCEPHNFTGKAEQKRLVIGGGATVWAEYVDETNVIPRTWPRAAAPAERLWSAASVNDTKEAAPRLEEHTCRLRRRGYNASPPNGSGFCLY